MAFPVLETYKNKPKEAMKGVEKNNGKYPWLTKGNILRFLSILFASMLFLLLTVADGITLDFKRLTTSDYWTRVAIVQSSYVVFVLILAVPKFLSKKKERKDEIHSYELPVNFGEKVNKYNKHICELYKVKNIKKLSKARDYAHKKPKKSTDYSHLQPDVNIAPEVFNKFQMRALSMVGVLFLLMLVSSHLTTDLTLENIIMALLVLLNVTFAIVDHDALAEAQVEHLIYNNRRNYELVNIITNETYLKNT